MGGTDRKARLAAELRANLARRKAQTRSRDGSGATEPDGELRDGPAQEKVRGDANEPAGFKGEAGRSVGRRRGGA
jgi:hypothetical protein